MTKMAKPLTSTQKEMALLHIISGMGGTTDSSESKWAWINWFCNDESNGASEDTFNRCHDKGWLRTGHDSDTDTSITSLTNEGREQLRMGDAS